METHDKCENGEPLSLAEINAIKKLSINQFWNDDDVASVKAYKLEKKIWNQKFVMKNKLD